MRKRTHRIWAHLSDHEYESFHSRIKKSGYSQEAYLRALIKGYVPRELPPAEYHAMMSELRIIANFMRQIAARANATSYIHAEEYDKNLQALLDVILQIQAAVVLPERIDISLN
jgi:hypothetical protein